MIKFEKGRLNLDLAQEQIVALKAFLDENEEINEAGAGGVLEFFTERPNLLLLAGDAFSGMVPSGCISEPFMLGEFRADFLVADETRENYLFIEFESAKSDSIFKRKGSPKTTQPFEWSGRFEHGFSQIVDWHFRISDYRHTSKIEEYFITRNFSFLGLLVIGRDRFIDHNGLRQRFAWRVANTVIDSKPIHCITFDKLYTELSRRLSNRLQMRDDDRAGSQTQTQ